LDRENRSMTPESGDGIDIVACYQEGWTVFKSAWHVYMVTAFIFLVVNILAGMVPLGGMIISGPMLVGFYLVIAEHLSGRGYNMGTLFQGFSYFIPAFMANLAITLFTAVGLLFLILPGLIIGSWYLLTFLFIADRKMDFWQAMEASREVAFRDMVGFAMFALSIIIVNLLGLLFLVFGTLVTIPVTFIAIFAAYRRFAGIRELVSEQGTPGTGANTGGSYQPSAGN